MDKKLLLITAILLILGLSSPAYAPWIWTPEGGWMNEKDIVKESPKAQWEFASGLEEKGEYNNAIRAYKSLIKAYPTSPFAARSEEKIASCYEHEGQLYEAFQAYQKLLENYPQQIDFDSVLKKEYRIGELFVSGKKRKVWKLPIMPAVDKGIEILETIVTNAPYSEIAPRAQFEIGAAYKKIGKYTEAAEAYNKVVENYSDTPWYEEALYQAGWCNFRKSRGAAYDQDSAKEAIKTFQKFQEEFPQSKHIPQIKTFLQQLGGRQARGTFDIARFYDKQGSKNAAIMYYKEILEKFPGTEEAVYAQKRLQKLEKK